jgi:protocatechuate 3,4-dioxygenase, alpha subunit
MNAPTLHETASQTAGPYVHIGLAPALAGFSVFEKTIGPVLVDATTPGERITLEGRVFDGTGEPMHDVLIECWQADALGLHAPASVFRGFGRSGVDAASGLYRFDTIKPGRVAAASGRLQAPHIALVIFARGINIGLHTRVYFGDEAAANAEDAVLASIEPLRRNTLMAQREQRGTEVVYRLDIRVQSSNPANETVFFDV